MNPVVENYARTLCDFYRVVEFDDHLLQIRNEKCFVDLPRTSKPGIG